MGCLHFLFGISMFESTLNEAKIEDEKTAGMHYALLRCPGDQIYLVVFLRQTYVRPMRPSKTTFDEIHYIYYAASGVCIDFNLLTLCDW